jgi:hypothetical protein
MSRYLFSSVLLSEDSITPSSSASQIFTSHAQSVTEIASFSSTSPPPELDLTRVQHHKQIIRYPTLPEKLVIFDNWWDRTSFACRRRQAGKPRLKWGAKERTSSIWEDFLEAAEFPSGDPKVCCIHCLHTLVHPAIDGSGTSSMTYHGKKGCRKKTSSTGSKRTITEMMLQKRVELTVQTQAEI